jgi:hypothetical protein
MFWGEGESSPLSARATNNIHIQRYSIYLQRSKPPPPPPPPPSSTYRSSASSTSTSSASRLHINVNTAAGHQQDGV